MIDDDVELSDCECPKCGKRPIYEQVCHVCGGEGHREYIDAPEEWGEDCPSEVNHLIECRECSGYGFHRWCPKCGTDYQKAKAAEAANP